MEHKGTLKLETERLILRQFTVDDIEIAYRNWMGDDEVTEFLTWPTHENVSVSEKVITEWIENYQNKTFYLWAIVSKELNEPIGSMSVVSMNEKTHSVHIGYCIGKKWWHQGYVSEAFSRIIPFFFYEVKARRIDAKHDSENPNSGKVMKKCGLKYEGTMRKAGWNNRGIVDECLYALLIEDYIHEL